MKIILANKNKNTAILKISKKDWQNIGKEAGWIKKSWDEQDEDLFKDDDYLKDRILEVNKELRGINNVNNKQELISKINWILGESGFIIEENKLMPLIMNNYSGDFIFPLFSQEESNNIEAIPANLYLKWHRAGNKIYFYAIIQDIAIFHE